MNATPPTPTAVTPVREPVEARLTLLGLGAGEWDDLLAGGVYAVVPQSPPARFPLWASLLKAATASGRVCHVLLRSDPAEFLERMKNDGWPEADQAFLTESLRLYPMVDGFSKLLFRMDVEALAAELAHWGVAAHDLLLVDSADELLSLHDLFLATTQLVKFKTWTKDTSVHLVLNFALAGAASGQAGLTSLMDHFSGLARLGSDSEGPVVTLEYWQSSMGTSAERTARLQVVGGAYQLRSKEPATNQRTAATGDRRSMPRASGTRLTSDNLTNDQVWARELQMMTGALWKSMPSMDELQHAALASRLPVVVLRFAHDTVLADLARSVHALRSGAATATRIVVAEHRVSLRYANELMLLRLGADAVIRQDVALNKWPGVLSGLQSQPPRPKPDLDVQTALANAASPQGKGYLEIPGFLSEVEGALERGHALGVPFALAVLHVRPDQAMADGVASAQCRRKGDFLTTDGEKLFVFFNACSLTRGPQVLESIFEGTLATLVAGIDWMASEIDIQQLMKTLKLRHEQRPFQLALQPAQGLPADAEDTAAALPSHAPTQDIPGLGLVPFKARLAPAAIEPPPTTHTPEGVFPLAAADSREEADRLVDAAPAADEPVVLLETPASEALHNRTKEAAVLNRVAPTPFGLASVAAGQVLRSRSVGQPVARPWVATSARSSLAARMSEAPPLGAGVSEDPAPSQLTPPTPTPAVRLAASRPVEPPEEPGVGSLLRRLAAPPEPAPKKATRFGGYF